MKLIVNADDFGMDEPTTYAITESFANGYINQATLMVNMPWTEKAVDEAKRCGFADKIGLHLNLTWGEPLTQGIRNSLLFCNEDGVMDKRLSQHKRLVRPFTGSLRRAILDEVEAQVSKYIALGLPLMHLDSHHHVHYMLPLLDLILRTMRDAGLKTIRPPLSTGFNGIGRYARMLRNTAFRALARHYGISCGDWIGSCRSFVELSKWLSGLDVVEVMVHPYFDAKGQLINITGYDTYEGPPMAEDAKAIGQVL